ncbi:hypothetical protein LCGC14_1226780 [marine sediment metagenome]|uniref:Uncharacterized protein n=1 Tax=marine sediment metagenome TaxID=412755 RepID=A0A0F9LWU1_9ZZZZ
MSEKVKEYFKNFVIHSICSICKDSGFFLQIDADVPSGLVCMRDADKHKFDCMEHSGFSMKIKLNWFKFRVANVKTGFWEYYTIAKYEQGTGEFEGLVEVEVNTQ